VVLDDNIDQVAPPGIANALELSPQSVQWAGSACAVGLGGLFGGRVVMNVARTQPAQQTSP
jgi:hypothetical protein